MKLPLLLLWLCCFTLSHAQRDTVRVVAAADLKFALTDLAKTFEATYPEVTVELSFGSSGNLYTQLLQGLPADLFFSADEAFPERLEAAQRVVPGTRQLYAVGRLVLWVRRDLVEQGIDPEALGLELLRDPRATELAIANPVHAPYGRGAVSLLEKAGLMTRTRDADWEAMTAGVPAFFDVTALEAGKASFTFVYGENVAQAAQLALLTTGVGILALPLVVTGELAERGEYWLAPLDAHERLDQAYVILEGRDRPAVRAFYDFVRAPEGRRILEAYGFLLPA
jgi:molybdate transport system substrate-binding protein